MLITTDSTVTPYLNPCEEYSYQVSEAMYHLHCAENSKKELEEHIKKYHEHMALAVECKKHFIA